MKKGVIVSGLLVMALTLGSAVWATAASTDAIMTQVQNYTTTGDIHEEAAAEDLLAMLTSVNTAIAQGDHVAAQSLLEGFIHAVRGLDGKLISSTAAASLISAAESLSVSL